MSLIKPRRFDYLPLLLVMGIMCFTLPVIGSSSTWLTLTVAGVAMGVIIFVVASGMTLVFGLMDVLNFGHGLFITAGAYVASSVLLIVMGWNIQQTVFMNLLILALTLVVAMLVVGGLSLIFERLIIRPVYGNHLKQILITMGGLIVGEELIKTIWGPQAIPFHLPELLKGSWVVAGATIEKFRVLVLVIGSLTLGGLLYVLNRTKLGLLIRAGVEDREMVESLGYNIKYLFLAVFVLGAMLAALGGALWGGYQQTLTPLLGSHLNILIFIVIMMGGLGSTFGSFVAAILVGLIANYTGFLLPKLALFSNIAVMVAILMWRPQGLYPTHAST